MSTTIHMSDAFAEQTFLNGMMARLKRRKLLIVALTLVFFAILFVLVEMLPKSYRGVASVEVEGQTPTAVQAGSVLHDTPFDEQTIGTELAILQSRDLLIDTIKQTHLMSDPEFNPTLHQSIMDRVRTALAGWLPAPEDHAVITDSQRVEEDTLETLKKHITLTPIPHSRVISIAVTAKDNILAAQIANTIADLYITNHKSYKQAASEDAHHFLETRIDQLREDAATKSKALEQYRIASGLTTATIGTLAQEQVSGLNTQFQNAQVQLAGLQAQADAAKHAGSPESLNDVLQSATISKYREQEGNLVAEQARLAASYGINSPVLTKINAQVAEVRRQIANEAHRSVSSLSTRLAAATANVAALSQQLNAVRAQALKTEGARARLQTLADDAASARNVYTDFENRLRAIDASMAYDATDIRVISHAAPPTRPSFPNALIMLPASFVLSLAAAGSIAYATARPKGLTGATEMETLYAIRPLGMIPIRTTRTEPLFQSAIQQLLNRLYYLPDKAPISIMITSALPQEGKTTTAQALAEEAQARGLKVVLVDADMRSTRVVKPKTSAQQIGLADLLRGTAEIETVMQHNKAGVPMIPAGSKGNPTRLMALPTMAKVIQHLTQNYQLVIVDAPPVLIGGDCEMLSRTIDATVMLMKWQSTAPEDVTFALRQLDMERVVGGVMTMVDAFKIGQFDSQDGVVFSRDLHRYYKQG